MFDQLRGPSGFAFCTAGTTIAHGSACARIRASAQRESGNAWVSPICTIGERAARTPAARPIPSGTIGLSITWTPAKPSSSPSWDSSDASEGATITISSRSLAVCACSRLITERIVS
jgi:hypothetical protein